MLVTLGDSLTYGDQDDPPGGGWPSRLQSLLHSRRPSSQVNNLARPGWTAHDLLHGRDGEPNQIDRAVELLREAPGEKIATVWIGVNDLFYLYAWGDPTESEEALALNRFKRDLGEVVQRLLDTGARVFLARLHDPAQEPARQHEALLGIAPDEWTRLTRLAEEFNAVIASIAASYQQPVVDIPASQVFSTAQWMHPDGIHPNARGYDELARVWLMALLAAPAP
jgi:lysophospholipase L1-like esterase